MKSDIELVQEVKAGERKAFSELVQRHQRTLLRMILRMTREQSIAEDVVQESFIKAYQKIDLFEGRSSFKSWLFQIALNTARNRFRDKTFESVNIDDTYLGVGAGAENGLVQADIKNKIREEIDKLPEKQRIALTLRVFEDMSFKEIAVIMGCPYDTAKANYRHALLKLRERLEDSEAVAGWDQVMESEDGAWDGAMSSANARAPEAEQ
jgi:RNA polymerase sigma-70 factor (ECF subfamily)